MSKSFQQTIDEGMAIRYQKQEIDRLKETIRALIDSQPTAAEITPILEHLIERYESLVHDSYDGTHKLEKLLEDAQPAREMLIRLKETPHG